MEKSIGVYGDSSRLDDMLKDLYELKVDRVNILQVFREQFDKLEKLRNVCYLKNINGNDRIREYFLLEGFIKEYEDLPNTKIDNYFTKIRNERKKAKIDVKVLKQNNEPITNERIKNADNNSRVIQVNTPKKQLKTLTPEQYTRHELDWNDSSWIIDASDDFFRIHFNIYNKESSGGGNCEPMKDINGNYIWSDYWENLYRYIIRDVKAKNNLQQWQIDIGYCHHDDKVNYIWDKLNKARKSLGMKVGGY